MKLVDDWHKCWKWLSVQFLAVASALQAATLAFPDVLRGYVGDTVLHYIALALLIAAVLGRLIDQGGSNASVPNQPGA